MATITGINLYVKLDAESEFVKHNTTALPLADTAYDISDRISPGDTYRIRTTYVYDDGGESDFTESADLTYPGSGGVIPDANWYGLWEAENAVYDGSNFVTAMPDSTANGNDLTINGNQTYIASGINGNPAIVFDGTDDFRLGTFSQGNLNLDNFSLFIVFQITDANANGSYHHLMSISTTDFTNLGSNWMQLYVPNATDEIRLNYSNNDIDSNQAVTDQLYPHFAISRLSATDSKFSVDGGAETTLSGTVPITLKNLLIGRIVVGGTSSGSLVKIAAIGIAPRFTDAKLAELNAWASQKYGI